MSDFKIGQIVIHRKGHFKGFRTYDPRHYGCFESGIITQIYGQNVEVVNNSNYQVGVYTWHGFKKELIKIPV